MIGGLPNATVIAVALAALWIAIAVALSVAAARRLREAGSVLASARSMASLLDVAPARPLLVHADGRVEVDPRLLRELGLDRTPARLADLGGDDCGIEKDDLEALIAEVEAAAVACERIERKVRAAG